MKKILSLLMLVFHFQLTADEPLSPALSNNDVACFFQRVNETCDQSESELTSQRASMNLNIKAFQNKYQTGVIDLIAHIQEGEFNIPISLDQHQELKNIPHAFQNGKGNYWIALDGEQVIGTMAFRDIGHNELQLRDVFVHEDYRGKQKGVSKKLLDTVLTWAKEHGIRRVYLGTTAVFLAAHRFYEKNGFIEIPKEQLPEYVSCHPADTKFYKYDLM